MDDGAAAHGISAEEFARLQRGEAAVFSKVYHQYVGLIQYVVRRCGAQASSADDIVQETFMRLLRKVNEIQQPAALKAWLVTTARRLTLDEIARGRRLVSGAEEGADIPDTAVESVQRELEIALVGEMVQQISADTGDSTLAEFYLLGRSAKDIASQRGEAISTVTTRLSRLRKRFQEHLRTHIEALRASTPE